MSTVIDTQPDRFPTVDILGLPVAVLTWSQGVELLGALVEEGRFAPVSFLNAHNANVAVKDSEFATAMRRFIVLPDGVGVDIAAKALYGRPFPANLNGTDFIPGFLQSWQTPLKVGLLGATSDNVVAASAALSRLAPQHTYCMISDGFFNEDDEHDILEKLRIERPDILLVAMGVPRQELWIDRNLNGEHCTVPIGVGALLDFLSGSVARAPAWVRQLRLEWAWRLLLEPQGLWRRYVIGNPLFLMRVMRQRLGGRANGQ